MVTIKEVVTKKDIKTFVRFPHSLYKGNPYYVPPFEADEVNRFNPKKNESYDECEVKCFLAYRDEKVLGRIAAIIQKSFNEKSNSKRCRFSRFDAIDDKEVSEALFGAVENFAKEKGMDIIHGPLGYNDLDREGLLIEGFDQLSTFEEQYNHPYYQKLVENSGFDKDTDWYEFRLFAPKEKDPRIERLSSAVLKRYKLRVHTPKNLKEVVDNYKDQFFAVVDAAYGPLYGTVPFTDKVKDAIIEQFKMILKGKFMKLLFDENDRLVALGIVLPSLSESINKTKGRLFPFGWIRVLHQINHPKHIDLALIALLPEYQNKGINAVILHELINGMVDNGIEYAETNLMLEDNTRIQHQWESFEYIMHKKRRAFVKYLNGKPTDKKAEKETKEKKAPAKKTTKAKKTEK